jgi:hypothetical protein
MISPLQILKEAIKAIPAVKYALGIAGIAASVAIVAGFQIDLRVAVFGTIIMIGLMTVLVVFARLAASPSKFVHIPALLLAWGFVILILASATLLFTSFFFGKPRELKDYVGENTNPAGVVNNDRLPNDVFLDAVSKKYGEKINWLSLNQALQKGADANAKGRFGITALLLASDEGNIEEVLFLLGRGADPRLSDEIQHATPLHRAALNNHPEVINALVGRGADPNAHDNYGLTPVDYSEVKGANAAKSALQAYGGKKNGPL